jgi:hypothetical protein
MPPTYYEFENNLKHLKAFELLVFPSHEILPQNVL